MQIREFIKFTVRFPSSLKKRHETTFDLTKKPELVAAIKRCIKSNRVQYVTEPLGLLFQVKPRFPLVRKAMKEPGNRNLLKVQVNLYTLAFYCGVENVMVDGNSRSRPSA